MNQLSDSEFLDYIDKVRKLRRPRYTDIDLEDTDVHTGYDFILGAAYLLMKKDFDPSIIYLNTMETFLTSLEREVNKYIKDCTDEEKCKQYPEFVRMLKVIYYELLARGVKAYPFVQRLRFDPKSLGNDHVLLDFIKRVKELPLPSNEEIKTADTDIPTGTDDILDAVDLLMTKKTDIAKITLHDMKLFLGTFERGIIDFERTCPDKKKCEQYLHFVQMLKAIYYELIERGVKPVPFPKGIIDSSC